ncbi:MAG: polyisoprenoid-binding protein YceI [Spirosomataceae bacterium]|jgi:polyisoprenoid-binding protein YceI
MYVDTYIEIKNSNKMKKTFLKITAIAFTIFTVAACNSAETSEDEMAEMEGITADITADSTASEVIWKGDMLGLYAHEGTINMQSGNLSIENGMVKSGAFTIDLASIKPTDDGYSEEKTADDLVGHLSSDDFFNVAEYPTATFEVTGSEGSEAMGNLTVRGKTNPETVKNVMVMEENGNVVVTGELTFDRTKYDVNFKMPVEDKVLSNDITLKIKVVGNK